MRTKACLILNEMFCCFEDIAFASGTGGLRFNFWAREIGHNVAKGSPRRLHFFKETVLPTGTMTRRWARQLVKLFGVFWFDKILLHNTIAVELISE